MGYSLDIKNTIWQRVDFDSEEQMLDVQEKLKRGELVTGLDVIDYLQGEENCEYLYETAEEIFPEENNGLATLEILDEDGDTIWHNGTDEHYYEDYL